MDYKVAVIKIWYEEEIAIGTGATKKRASRLLEELARIGFITILEKGE